MDMPRTYLGNNKFIMLGFAQSAVPDTVFIEGLTGDLYLDDPRDVETYELVTSSRP
jgi:Domain of unknown function (DUF5753)